MIGALTGGRVNGEVMDCENFAFIQAINPMVLFKENCIINE
jgi:hypothetical protein